MKKKLAVVSFLFFFSSHNSFAQSIQAPYEVGTWQGFRSAAISYTFDDNCGNQLAKIVPMFNEYDFKLTLFTVINWGPNWTSLQNAVSHGHEIASHTMGHPSLGPLSDSLQTIELKNSQDAINSHITGQKCATISYPNCNVGDTSLARQYYLAARGCSGVIESGTPNDFMNISSIGCGSQGVIKTSADFNSRANSAASVGGWCVYLLHAIDNDPGYSPLSSDTLRASLEYLKANPEKFWVTSFGNAVKYIRERNTMSVSEILVMEDSITISVSDALDDSMYNCPITIRRPLPQNWSSAYIMQNGDTVASQIVNVDSVQYLMFDVIPDNGDITLIKNSTTGIELLGDLTIPSSAELYQNYPNPFNPTTQISYTLAKSGFVTLKVFDVLGREIQLLVNEHQEANRYTLLFDAGKLASGIYFYQLKAGIDFTDIKKMILLR